MGQYWKFVNIDKRETTGHLGKLAEFFFSDEAQKILFLLAVPTIPQEPNGTNSAPGSWAGDRIICLGDYAGDWPAGCITAADFANLPTDEGEYNGGRRAGTDGILPPSSLYRASTEITAPGSVPHNAYPKNCVWVLRNLTKKVYIRSNGIPTLGEADPFAYTTTRGLSGYPGLGHVLLANIAWSEDLSASGMDWDDLTMGEWAGDRFDVRTFSDVQESMREDGWQDVSEENAEKLHGFWVGYDGNPYTQFEGEPRDRNQIQRLLF